MTEERRRLEPLRLNPPKQSAPVAPREAAGTQPIASPPGVMPRPQRRSPTLVLITAIVVLSILLVAVAITPIQSLLGGQRAPASPPTAPSPATNDGSDPARPVLPPPDTAFVNARGGWGWGNRCSTNINARKWGWAKAECDRGIAMNPAAPDPRASLLYNEGLIAKAGEHVEEARQDFATSLALRENAEVRAALNSLPAPSGGANPTATVDSRDAERVQTPAGVVAVVRVQPMGAVIKLGAETIYPPTCPRGGANCGKIKAVRDDDTFGGVRIVNRVAVPGANQAVLVMQEEMQGNACNGTSLWFSTFNTDGSYVFSEPIGYCGGPEPTVSVAGSLIHLTVPAHPPNRGTGTIPGFDYAYDMTTGALQRLR